VVLFLNSSASDATPEFVNKTEKTLTNNSKQKTQTDQKKIQPQTQPQPPKDKASLAWKREAGQKKRQIALHSRYVTYIHVPACGSNRRERRCKCTTVEREPPERERERERTEPHLIKKINPT
jgi:hypothetical protein